MADIHYSNSGGTGAQGPVGPKGDTGATGATPTLTALASDLLPATDNTYLLGNADYRWKGIHIGPGTIYITDTVTGNDTALTVTSGVLKIDGANQLQVGQLKFVDNTIESTSGTTDIQIGLLTSSADIVLNRDVVIGSGKTLTFSDGSVQEMASAKRMHYLNRSQVSLANDSSKQSILGLTNGVALEANTRYAYVIRYRVRATADSVNLFYCLEGSAGFNFHQYDFNVGRATYAGAFSPVTKGWTTGLADNQVRNAVHMSYGELGGTYWKVDIRGAFDTTTAGTMKPMVLLSPIPGVGSYVQDGSYIEIIKLGPAGAGNTAIGMWS